jgi:DNA-binding transcriptional LysR family regulator
MAKVDIRRLDMSLLLTFQSLLRTQRTTATAAELGVTQSSVSHALSRLRDIFADELFQRRPNGLAPTRRALELSPLVTQALDLVHEAVAPRPFEPASATGVMKIAALDYHCSVLAPGFLDRIGRQAPGVQVSFRPLARRAAIRAVVAGQVDLAIGTFDEVPDGVEAIPLWQDPFVAVVGNAFAPSPAALSLEAYAKASHLIVSLNGDLSSPVDDVLAEKGLSRKVVASLPYCVAAVSAVSAMNAVLTIPARLARQHQAAFGLRIFELPFALRPFDVTVLRVRRAASDPLIDWCVERLVEAAAYDTDGLWASAEIVRSA